MSAEVDSILTINEVTIQLDSLVAIQPPLVRYAGDDYEYMPLNDSIVTPIIILLFIFLSLSLRRRNNIFNNIIQGAFSVKKRRTDYDVKSTYDSYINGFLLFNSIAAEGLFLYFLLFKYGSLDFNYSFKLVSMLMLYVGLFLLFRFSLNKLFGYIFSDKDNTHLLIEGLLSTQKLKGLLLIPPILVMAFNPSLIEIMLVISVIVYAISSIIFMVKVWRIFFSNLYFLFYFILYLCAIEIIPLLNFYLGMFQLNRFLIF